MLKFGLTALVSAVVVLVYFVAVVLFLTAMGR